MTKVKCGFIDLNDKAPCKHRGEDGYCTREKIFVQNGSEYYYHSSNLPECASRYDWLHDELEEKEG